MSAWLCSNHHLAVIATAVEDYNAYPGRFEELGELLLLQNFRSLQERYGSRVGSNCAPFEYRRVAATPVQVVKACDSYD